MLEKVVYENNRGELLEIGTGSIFANTNDLRDYEWAYSSDSDIVSNLNMGIKAKSLPMIFVGSEARKSRDKAFEVFSYDVALGAKGKLYIGEYWLNCWVHGAENKSYLETSQYINTTFKIVTDDTFWHSEYKPEVHSSSSASGFEFPFDFPFGLSLGETNEINNPFATESDFILTIYGSVSTPKLTINNHIYQINDNLSEGDYVVVNSTDKTIRKRSLTDTTVNVNYFNKRYKAHSIFQKIPSGKMPFSQNGEFDFDIVLVDKRAEPPWNEVI